MRAGILLLCLWAPVCAAQTMYKCTDSQRRITYSNETCEKQGLKDAGPVATDRVTTMPSGPGALPTQKLKPPVEMPKNRDSEIDRGGAQIQPVVPLTEKLSK